jgi:hypothetical protein
MKLPKVCSNVSVHSRFLKMIRTTVECHSPKHYTFILSSDFQKKIVPGIWQAFYEFVK